MRTLQGDTQAFGRVVDRCQAATYACAVAVLGSRDDAEDAVQDAFITAYSRLGDLRDLERFPGWLHRITLSACGRIARRSRLVSVPMAAADVPSREGDPEHAIERAESLAQLGAAFAALPPRHRAAAALFYLGDHSVGEVAALTGTPPGTVKYHLHEARKHLREVLMNQQEEAAAPPRPDLRDSIIATLMARKARFDERIAAYFEAGTPPEPSQEWADEWHRRRMEDVRANARQYGVEPDETLPRMLAEYHAADTFRDDFLDVPRRWGVPPGTRLIGLRDLARRLGVTPQALRRWEGEGLPVLRYYPWEAYDEARAGQWARDRNARPEERMTARDAREPALVLLRAVASGTASAEEAVAVWHALSAPAFQPDPLWQPKWTARHAAEREANGRQYGLEAPAAGDLGIPDGAQVFEIRDLGRRLGLSPFDVLRWTREGMPCVRKSPRLWWDPVQVARWLADRESLPERDFTMEELDDLPSFVVGAVARRDATPEDGRDVLAAWTGTM